MVLHRRQSRLLPVCSDRNPRASRLAARQAVKDQTPKSPTAAAFESHFKEIAPATPNNEDTLREDTIGHYSRHWRHCAILVFGVVGYPRALVS